MADNKATTVTERKPVGKTSNPSKLVWPYDKHGFTTLVRKEGVRAVGRIKGDEAKLSVFIETLKVLGEHAKAKLSAQKEAKQRDLDAAAARAAKRAADAVREKELEIERLRALVASTEADIAAKEADVAAPTEVQE